MFNPCVSLLLLHVVILSLGSTVVWAANRWPRTVGMVSGFIVAGGGWAMWSAGDVMKADGPEAGERLLRVGQWVAALGVAAWGLLAVVRQRPGTPAALVGWTDWAKALAAYWVICFVVPLVEGVVIVLGTTPHGQFR
jgi:hypothetical protein